MCKVFFIVMLVGLFTLTGCLPQTDGAAETKKPEKHNVMGSGDKPMPKEADYK